MRAGLWPAESGSARGEQMPELFFLRLQVIFRVRIGSNLARNALDHGDTALFKSGNLVGIIGEQADFTNPERLENFGG